jgi:hypothetical protein
VDTAFVTLGQLSRQAVSGASNASETVKGIVELSTNTETAAGTSAGGTSARLALPTSLANATPGSCDSTACVVIAVAGKIAQGFLDLTANFTWIGTHTFSNTVTANGAFNSTATTTFSANVVGTKTINTFTAGEAITLTALVPRPVFVATSTPSVWLSDANVASTTPFLGFAVSNAAAGASVSVQTDGIVSGFTGLTPGSRYYVSDTVGTIQTTVGTSEAYVGIALSSTQLFIDKGAQSSWQYLGSQGLTVQGDTPITHPYARFAIIDAKPDDNASVCQGQDTVTLAKVGITTAAISEQASIPAIECVLTFVWTSTSSIRTSGSLNSTATAYFYR